MATGEVPKIAEVIKLASAAVQADSVGDLERAVSLYQQAADALAAMVASGTGSESDTKEWEGKAAQYKARVTYLQQRVQQEKIQQYANTAKLAQDGMQLAAKGQEAVKSAGGPTPLAGAAAVGAGVGLMLAGPIGALAGAAGIAYAATTKENAVGEIARKTGQVAVDGFGAVKNFDQEYGISKKAWSASVAGVNKINEIDKQYKVHEKVIQVTKNATESVTSFEQKHNIVAKMGKGLSDALDWTTTKLGGTSNVGDDADSAPAEAFPDVPSNTQ